MGANCMDGIYIHVLGSATEQLGDVIGRNYGSPSKSLPSDAIVFILAVHVHVCVRYNHMQ